MACDIVERYVFDNWGDGTDITLPDFTTLLFDKEIHAVSIGGSSEVDQVLITFDKFEIAKSTLVGVRRPWIGEVNSKKMELMPSYATFTSFTGLPTIRGGARLELLVHLATPSFIPIRRDPFRYGFGNVYTAAQTNRLSVPCNGRSRFKLSANLNITAGAGTFAGNVWGVTAFAHRSLGTGLWKSVLDNGTFCDGFIPATYAQRVLLQSFNSTVDAQWDIAGDVDFDKIEIEVVHPGAGLELNFGGNIWVEDD